MISGGHFIKQHYVTIVAAVFLDVVVPQMYMC